MRKRDSSESRFRRISASILKGNFAAVLAECDLEEEASGPHWRINAHRGYAYIGKKRFDEARDAFGKVKAHSVECRDPLCLSKGVYIGLYANACAAGLVAEALSHLNVYLREEPEDIFVLFLRGRLQYVCWTKGGSGNDELLDEAIYDLHKAYALLGGLPDEKFYTLKVLREASEVRFDEMENRCRDVERMTSLMEINPILYGSTDTGGVDAGDANAFRRTANTLFGNIGSANFERMMIGFLLTYLFCLAETVDYWVAAVKIVDEIEPLVRENDDVEFLAMVLGLSAEVKFRVYNTCGETYYLDAATSSLADLLILREQHTLPDEILESVEKLVTDIDNLLPDGSEI